MTSHGWRAGADTDMIEAGVPHAERNSAGRWAPGSHTTDTEYGRQHGLGPRDPLANEPLYGDPAHAAIAAARAGGPGSDAHEEKTT